MLFVLIEILSCESRISIGDKIRKEGVLEINVLLYFFIWYCIFIGGGKVCFFIFLCCN